MFTWEVNKLTLGLKKEAWTQIVIDAYELQGVLSPSQLGREWEESLEGMYPHVQRKEYALECVSFCKRAGIKIALATSSTSTAVKKKRLNHEDLFGLFDVIICGDTVTNSKPHPEIFLTAADELGVSPLKCLAFEDSLR